MVDNISGATGVSDSARTEVAKGGSADAPGLIDRKEDKELEKSKDDFSKAVDKYKALKDELKDLTEGSTLYKNKKVEADAKLREISSMALKGASLSYDEIGMTEEQKQQMIDLIKKQFKKFLDQGNEYVEELQSAIAMTITSSGGPINMNIFYSNISSVAMHMMKLEQIKNIGKQDDDIRLSSVESQDAATHVAQGMTAQEKAQQVRSRSYADQLAEQEQPVDAHRAVKNIMDLVVGVATLTNERAAADEIIGDQKSLLQKFHVAISS